MGCRIIQGFVHPEPLRAPSSSEAGLHCHSDYWASPEGRGLPSGALLTLPSSLKARNMAGSWHGHLWALLPKGRKAQWAVTLVTQTHARW